MEQLEIQEKIKKAYELVDAAALQIKVQFRSGQRDVCTAVIAQYLIDPTLTVILDAPTGSGKSVIATICSVAICIDNQNAQTFVITSDKLLQQQYFDTLANTTSSAVLFGRDNYTCHKVDKIFNDGYCSVNRITKKNSKSMDCYKNCSYYQAHDQAISANLTVLNYNSFLIHQNIVNEKIECDPEAGVSFGIRTATFFDESHKIRGIVQDMFVLTINDGSTRRWFEMIKAVVDFYGEMINNKEDASFLSTEEFEEIKTEYNQWINLLSESNGGSPTITILKQFIVCMTKLVVGISSINKVNEDMGDHAPLEITKCVLAYSGFYEIFDKCRMYLGAIDENEHNSVIDVEHSATNMGESYRRILLRNVDESELVRRYVLAKSNFTVFMSATFGNDLPRFAQLNGIDQFKPIQMQSTFKFDNSAIMKVCKFNLSAKHRGANIGPALQFIDGLMGHPVHAKQRGIIHTGSYEMMDIIKNSSKHAHRLLTYRGSAEKAAAIERHRLADDMILCGPSLSTGVDLPDDLARFMIMFKTPYPSLGDNLVRTKLDRIEGWYELETTIEIQQQLGRPIRHENDNCVTYLVDSNLARFFDANDTRYFPEYIRKRIK